MGKIIILALATCLLFTPLQASSEDSYDASKIGIMTRQEIDKFLDEDLTSENTYHWLVYNCLDFAVDL